MKLHSPLPWRTLDGQIFSPHPEVREDETLIADTAPENIGLTEYDELNAEFIVQAVNAHEDLLAVLEDERDALQRWQSVKGLPKDVAEGMAISSAKIACVLAQVGK